MDCKLAPICLFTYNRLDETQQTVSALQHNYLAAESELFIFSDGPKKEHDIEKVNEVRRFICTITGFKKITIFKSVENKGLANSIITGVSKIVKQYGKIIVLEDDLITSPNYLDFMNQALNFYERNPSIHSISGYSLDLPSLKYFHCDYYFGYRASSWGWATWKDKWESTDWEVADYIKFKYNILQQLKFMRGGSDMPKMLKSQMKGKIDSWAIRWCFSQFQNNQLTVFPSISKVVSIGFGPNATHTKHSTKFETRLDTQNKRNFVFSDKILIYSQLNKESRRKFSFLSRLIEFLNSLLK